MSASHTEGFPNNILEAMCSRLPVVATAIGGVPELCVHDVTGLLVDADKPDALGSAILALANDNERRARMGSAGYHRAKANFSIQRKGGGTRGRLSSRRWLRCKPAAMELMR